SFLKGSNATSARATAPRATGRSSGRPRPSPISDNGFALAGPSDPPEPDYNAYRNDLADVALAGCVIASHYAEPLGRVIVSDAVLRRVPNDDAEAIRELAPGETFDLLDESLGWAWGYAGKERRAGDVRGEPIG